MAALDSDIAVVTGAGRNVGREIACILGAEGASVAVIDIDPDRAEGTVTRITADGGDAIPVVADVSREASVNQMIEAVEREFGPVTILVNNAAVRDTDRLLDTDVETFDRVVDVNLRGLFLVTREAAESMRNASTTGRIVNVGSTSGRRGRNGCIAYATTKSAVYNFTRSIAKELAEFGIRANSVTPTRTGLRTGELDTPTPAERTVIDDQIREEVPLGRLGEPVDIARVVSFLVSDNSDFVTGTDILIDGGRSA